MPRPRPITLSVGNMPSNRLALTNRIYLSSTIYNFLIEALNNNNSSSSNSRNSSSSCLPLVSVNQHVYLAEANDAVPPESIAMNGLQRRHAQLSLGSNVEITPFVVPSSYCLAGMEVSVDLLVKKSNNATNGKPREIDTDRLAADFCMNYEGHVFEVGQVLAMDFEGIKLELTVSGVSPMDLEGRNGGTSVNDGDKATVVGQFLAPTNLTFARPQGGSNLITLTGDKVAGGSGAANTIFLSDFDFEKLGIGGLDAEFNQIFRRAFASRIWPAHVIKQMGINHVRGMLLLFGPPGCGKTLIARQIGKVLNAREPKIVNGPEILNKYVGGSEEKVRELFAEAKKSMLHIVILDEMDAICKQRGDNLEIHATIKLLYWMKWMPFANRARD
eukprot:scaffold17216_cov64-Cyclotella_meneghiniana.AAC.1